MKKQKIFLIEEETNNSIGAEIKNQHCTEKRNDANKIKKGIRYF